MQKISLPVDSYMEQILAAFNTHDNVILTAPPGSGKTTRVPPALLKIFKKIIVLVPRRIAAVSTAVRIAEENNYVMGDEVGYQVRFEKTAKANTRLIFMTEGVFIKKLNDPALWDDLELIIIDEFHERSSSIDLALGICLEKQILEQKIKMLVMSATLNVEKIQTYLGSSQHIEVLTQPFPLDIIHSKKSQRLVCDYTFAEQLLETLSTALIRSKKDILIFLPGLSEIRFIERLISEKFKSIEINILHGSVKLEEQKRILTESNQRRIILSTNIAESSITIPSVDCVLDSGLEKKAVVEQKIGFKKLDLNRISLFSARQRAGRAARTGPGLCYRLWHELDERSMPEQIQPEIITSDLLEESLTLLSLNIRNPDQFSWLDKPKKSFQSAFTQLNEWGLIDSDLAITQKGSLVQSCPLDTEKSLIFIELSSYGLQKEASAFMAYLETTNFDKQSELPDLEHIRLNDLGRKIEAQLNQFKLPKTTSKTSALKETLIQIFFKSFPHKIAKRKDKNTAISSLGRGVELSAYLLTEDSDYFLLLSGREQNAMTKCDFAIAFSTFEFEKYSSENIKQTTDIQFDTEKKKLFKIDKKIAGFFVISESSKMYLNEKENRHYFKDFFKNGFMDLIQEHLDYKNYVTKINFLKKKSTELGYSENDFLFLDTFKSEVYASLAGSLHSVEEFFDMQLFEILLFSTPEIFKNALKNLPSYFTLPHGKQLEIDYESEQAPKVSARIQEFFGLKTNPVLLNGKVRMTIELLAPNYRPAQVTSQLEKFWQTSYLEIRKEFKARYPRHAWPEVPTEYIPPVKRNKN